MNEKKKKKKKEMHEYVKKVEVAGIDPAAPRMQSECSTIWATPPYWLYQRKLHYVKKKEEE